jgi:hypothetical protein
VVLSVTMELVAIKVGRFDGFLKFIGLLTCGFGRDGLSHEGFNKAMTRVLDLDY